MTFPHCDLTSYTYFTFSTFQAHERIHTGERIFKCPNCGKTFLQQSSYSAHKNTCIYKIPRHANNKFIKEGSSNHVCGYCGKEFESRRTYMVSISE